MTKLSVNLNKIALLRNQRDIGIPSVIESARTVIDAGAHGVTVHPRPDERHIRFADVYELAEMVTVEFNIEGNPFTGKYMEIVRDVRPDQATLVPDSPGASTSDHGWDLCEHGRRVSPIVRELKDQGIRVSLFLDPDPAQIERARDIDADRIELYTEPYASAFRRGSVEDVFEQYVTPNSWDDKVEIIRQFIAECGPPLAATLRNEPPERYARDYETLIRSYVTALERTSSIFRRL